MRARQGGEWLAGANQTVRVKDWLRRTGLPPWLRDNVPLLVSDDEVLAIGDCLLSGSLQAWLQQQHARLCWAPANPALAHWRASLQNTP